MVNFMVNSLFSNTEKKILSDHVYAEYNRVHALKKLNNFIYFMIC